MTTPRLFVSAKLAAAAQVILDERQAHQLLHVLRLRVGAEARLFNGDDGEWSGRIAAARRRTVEVVLEGQVRPPVPEPGPTLVFAPIRKSRLEWLVEKAVELGAARLVPVLTRRTVARLENPARLQAIAIEAAEQCERLTVPSLEAPRPLADWLRARDTALPLLFADERGRATPLLTAMAGLDDAEILIGPEGGFAPEERQQVLELPAMVPVSLGPRILRAETAALYALACWDATRSQAG